MLANAESFFAMLRCAVLCSSPVRQCQECCQHCWLVAANVLRGDHPVVHWDTVDWEAIRADVNALIVDVREVSRQSLGVCVWVVGGGSGVLIVRHACAAAARGGGSGATQWCT